MPESTISAARYVPEAIVHAPDLVGVTCHALNFPQSSPVQPAFVPGAQPFVPCRIRLGHEDLSYVSKCSFSDETRSYAGNGWMQCTVNWSKLKY